MKLRELVNSNREIAHKVTELEQRLEKHDQEIQAIFDAIRQLLETPTKSERQIGFRVNKRLGVYRVFRRKS